MSSILKTAFDLSVLSQAGRDVLSAARRVRPAAVIVIACAVFAAACANGRNARDEYIERPVETLYSEAVRSLEIKRYDEAIRFFDEVERQHPYSPWARRSMLMAAYANYVSNNYEDAIQAVDRFLALHPGNKDAPYAYYLRAMCYYERILDVNRDQEMTAEALNALQEVMRRYPGTDYARDARLKVDLTHDHLAGKEMLIGRYYLEKNQHVAAINRFRTVIEQYQTTTHTPEALHRLVESYLELGLAGEAQAAAAVLGYNYPGSRWYEDSYRLLARLDLAPREDDKSWLSKLFGRVL